MNEYLKKALAENQLPNTLLFVGAEGKQAALELADTLRCAKTDLHVLVPEGKLHSIESIRQSIDISHSAPFESPCKVFIIEAAEHMQPAAANALLKTLEEPVLDSYWILLATHPAELLPTIVSRCSKVVFQGSAPPLNQAILDLLTHRPSYPQLSAILEKIEEDDNVFATIAHHFRDTDPDLWEEALEEARLGYERNIKIFTCLETFFLRI